MKLFITVFVLLNLYGAPLYAAESTITLSEAQFKNLGVKLGKPEAVQQAPLLNAPAQVVVPPTHEYVVSAAQAGLIGKLEAAAGDSVKKGQILAKIDSPELVSLQEQYLQAISASHLAGNTYQRDKKLHDEGVIADRRWQESSAEFNMQSAAENEARQLLAIAGMAESDIKRLAATRRLNSLMVVRAPDDGVVLERMAKAGERVTAQQPLYRIANLDELWLEIAIPQQRAHEIKTGDGVIVQETAATAHLSMLGRSVDPQTQTVLGRAIVDGGQNNVRVGQMVHVLIVQTSTEPMFKLPDSAVALNAGQAYVFSRTPEGFTVKAVQLIGKQGGYTFVAGALQADEDLAVSGAVALKANWLGLGGGEE